MGLYRRTQTPAETAAINNFLATDPIWQEHYQRLLNLHQLLNQSELEIPSMRFTKNVMEAISHTGIAPATKNYINKNVIRGITAFLVSMIAGLVIYFGIQFTPVASHSSNLQVPDLGLDKINYTHIFNNAYTSAFMLIATLSGLVLFDAWLRRKRILNKS